jgi:hypothetical protein
MAAVGTEEICDAESTFYYDPPKKPKPEDLSMTQEQLDKEINDIPQWYSEEMRSAETKRLKHNYESRASVRKRKEGLTPAGVRDAEKREEKRLAMEAEKRAVDEDVDNVIGLMKELMESDELKAMNSEHEPEAQSDQVTLYGAIGGQSDEVEELVTARAKDKLVG